MVPLTAALVLLAAPAFPALPGAEPADLAVTAAIDPVGAVAGGTATAVIVARNAGPGRARAVRIAADVPDGVIGLTATSPDGSCTVAGAAAVCTVPALPPGGTAVMTITAGVPAATPAGTAAALTATVTSSTPEAERADNTTTVTATLTALADLGVTLTGPGTATVTNAGPSVARGITLTVVPGGTEHPVPDLDPGRTATVALPAASRPVAVAVGAGTPDPAPAGNSAADRPSGSAVADVGVALTLSATSGYAGSAVPCTVTVTNHGPSAATDVLVRSTASALRPSRFCTPLACTLPTLAPGASVVLTGKVKPAADAPPGPGWVGALAVSPAADDNAANDTDTVPFTVLAPARRPVNPMVMRRWPVGGSTVLKIAPMVVKQLNAR